ncbi:uncharacterized protein LOC125943814 isoform X2 [Dermacentor silvarum]|uniref:uncharacterized protein LOC125940696 n=1 Tax=Dermacentor silvarum TaxID=543639 RepID=UPI002100CF9B|nr:uncharacterized protein LOC125940696 [Dermacentor silvarum]XP_049519294.1 uncharacterized protein LOC125943814 isoform X2 [Dermacentor silvarum]
MELEGQHNYNKDCWLQFQEEANMLPMQTSLPASTDCGEGSADGQVNRMTTQHTSSALAPEPAATPMSSTAQEATKQTCRKWDKNFLPSFSAYLNPLLHGQEMLTMARRRMTAQLRDEVIEFLEKNNLIKSSNSAVRRWNYCAFAEALSDAYPRMVWETKGTAAVQQLGWAISENVTDPERIDLSRMNMLLHATIEVRKKNPVEELPVYFLNAAVVSVFT